jgi:hypothetical protein
MNALGIHLFWAQFCLYPSVLAVLSHLLLFFHSHLLWPSAGWEFDFRGFDSAILPLQNMLCAGWLNASCCEYRLYSVLQPGFAATIRDTLG